MARADSQLEFDDLRPDGDGASGLRGQFWLKGSVATCACPDCSSPMTIRLWLMAADCWVCGASVVLSEEQQREVKRLLEEAQAKAAAAAPQPEPPKPKPAPPPEPVAQPKPQPAPKPKPPAPKPVEQPRPAPQKKQPPPIELPRPKPAPPPVPTIVVAAPPESERRSAAHGPSRARRRLHEISQEGEVTVWLRDMFRNLPAWLISAILHMALLILLAMVLDMDEASGDPPLILSTRVAANPSIGAEGEKAEEDPIEFAKKGTPDPKEESKQPDPPTEKPEPMKQPPDPGEAPLEKKPPTTKSSAAAPTEGGGIGQRIGLSPDARARVTEREGGTTQTEAAVTRGLEWLARHQNSDGSWSLHAFHKANGCNGRCRHPGTHSDTAGTGLALLPFLGVGETHQKEKGKYREVVENGLKWLVRNQRRDGDLRGAGAGRMYAHGMAAIALCEAYAMTRDPDLRAPAQASVDFIVKAQHSQGGWRYEPGQAGDVSVVGWQYMALRSGQMAYLTVPEKTIERAIDFVDTCKTDRYGGQYTYQPGVNYPLPAMTAEALLCRQYGGWPHDHQGVIEGCRWMLKQHPPSRTKSNMYYWYYATQVMHHMGGASWTQWNSKMRDLLVSTQVTSGHEAGSWTPQSGGERCFDTEGGRLYMTALAVCTLEVYYRHLPLYRRAATEK